jgi:hypothetical protein
MLAGEPGVVPVGPDVPIFIKLQKLALRDPTIY